MQTSCKNPLFTSPQFTFWCEKELNLHVNPFKLKYPLSNPEIKSL